MTDFLVTILVGSIQTLDSVVGLDFVVGLCICSAVLGFLYGLLRPTSL